MAKRKARIPKVGGAFGEGQAYAILRTVKGFTLIQLAETTGLDRNTFRELEFGSQSSESTKRTIRDALGVREETVQKLAAVITAVLLSDTTLVSDALPGQSKSRKQSSVRSTSQLDARSGTDPLDEIRRSPNMDDPKVTDRLREFFWTWHNTGDDYEVLAARLSAIFGRRLHERKPPTGQG